MPDTHAILSASSANRWIHCPPSVMLTKDMPDTTSEFAKEGTLAHELAELKLRKKFEAMRKTTYDKHLKEIEANSLYQQEMQGYTDEYLDYILSIALGYKNVKPYVVIEKKLDFSSIVPEGFGTGDCVMIIGNDLHIIDFKYGKGVPVSAEENPQLKLYALGAATEYSFMFPITNVTMHIVQPRLDIASKFMMPLSELNNWGESIKPIAEKAMKGEGEYQSGDWCKFCKARATCRKRSDEFSALSAFGNALPPLLDDNSIGEVLTMAESLENWVSDLEKYALDAILEGKQIPGWKAVEGRSNRVFKDIDKAFEVIKSNGFDEALLYERKPITLTNAEKLVGKKQFTQLVGDYIDKPQGKPTLAPESDKREPYKKNVAEMFGEDRKDK